MMYAKDFYHKLNVSDQEKKKSVNEEYFPTPFRPNN